MGHVGDTVTDVDDTELRLFYGGNYERDNNCEKWVQCICCFHWDHEECVSGTLFARSACKKQELNII